MKNSLLEELRILATSKLMGGMVGGELIAGEGEGSLYRIGLTDKWLLSMMRWRSLLLDHGTGMMSSFSLERVGQ
jgi:hypothetical protein